MDIPNRKQIRLHGYDYSRNGGYFLTLCTYNRGVFFGKSDSLDEMFRRWLFEIENKYPGVKIDLNIFMLDHMHFVLFKSDQNAENAADKSSSLPLIIKWYKTMTTNDYIKGVKSGSYDPFDKHIWQRNYFEHIIRNEDDLYNIRAYIRDNPKNWENMYAKPKC